jgi:hypothetical protein
VGKNVARALNGGRRRWGMAIVSGNSMLPSLRHGDRVLVEYGHSVAVGMVVVADFPDGTTVVKRVAFATTLTNGEGGWWLGSDNREAGVDSRHRGAIAENAVHGVVRLRIWPRPARIWQQRVST